MYFFILEFKYSEFSNFKILGDVMRFVKPFFVVYCQINSTSKLTRMFTFTPDNYSKIDRQNGDFS